MAYVAWSVVFGEQPSAAKWNILGANDASFNDGSGLNNISNPITAASSSHLALVAGTNKLVKTTVLRQDDTTNTYQSGNSVLLTGWGVGVPGASGDFLETVTFGVTFSQRPIVTISYGGDNTSGTLTYGAGASSRKYAMAIAHSITTTSFSARLRTSDGGNWTAGDSVFYQWTAIGELA